MGVDDRDFHGNRVTEGTCYRPQHRLIFTGVISCVVSRGIVMIGNDKRMRRVNVKVMITINRGCANPCT